MLRAKTKMSDDWHGWKLPSELIQMIMSIWFELGIRHQALLKYQETSKVQTWKVTNNKLSRKKLKNIVSLSLK